MSFTKRQNEENPTKKRKLNTENESVSNVFYFLNRYIN